MGVLILSSYLFHVLYTLHGNVFLFCSLVTSSNQIIVMRILWSHAILGGFLEAFCMRIHILPPQTPLSLSDSYVYCGSHPCNGRRPSSCVIWFLWVFWVLYISVVLPDCPCMAWSLPQGMHQERANNPPVFLGCWKSGVSAVRYKHHHGTVVSGPSLQLCYSQSSGIKQILKQEKALLLIWDDAVICLQHKENNPVA